MYLATITCYFLFFNFVFGYVADQKRAAPAPPCKTQAALNPPSYRHCGDQGSVKNPVQLSTPTATSQTLCRNQCLGNSQCISFSYEYKTSTCKLYSITIDNQNFITGKTGVFFWNHYCYTVTCPKCPTSQTKCGAFCTSISNDPSNCGSCGHTCGSSQECCGSSCVDSSSDPMNCGTCGTQCPSGSSCTSGVCSCPSGQSTCGGSSCIDLTTNQNCGSCGNTCTGDLTCTGGTCQCPSGQSTCGGGNTCFSLNTDNNNCGSCGNTCTGGTTCTNGTCQCPSGQSNCGGTCTSLNTDNDNCGSCGNICTGVTTCSSGTCQCPLGQSTCGGSCTFLNTDDQNCGSCGNICTGSTTCSNGTCQCPSGQSTCGGTCTTLNTDDQNCGSCGNICTGGTTCSSGTCQCLEGQSLCNGVCKDLQNDEMNCGSCNNQCPSEATSCSSGTCVCPSGQAYCGGTCVAVGNPFYIQGLGSTLSSVTTPYIVSNGLAYMHADDLDSTLDVIWFGNTQNADFTVATFMLDNQCRLTTTSGLQTPGQAEVAFQEAVNQTSSYDNYINRRITFRAAGAPLNPGEFSPICSINPNNKYLTCTAQPGSGNTFFTCPVDLREGTTAQGNACSKGANGYTSPSLTLRAQPCPGSNPLVSCF